MNASTCCQVIILFKSSMTHLLNLILSSFPSLPQLPVITNLRNPSLKQRHWDNIENILEYNFTKEEPMTLGLLTSLDAFAHTEAIEEVSGQASSEAALETLLKKVLKLLSWL